MDAEERERRVTEADLWMRYRQQAARDGVAASGCRRNCPRPLAETPHLCPYGMEINEDHESLCLCCEDCEQECADDI